jgi:hypothetical protein
MSNWAVLIIGSLGALFTGAGGFYIGLRKVRSDVSRTEADARLADSAASKTVVDAALLLLEPYRVQLEQQAKTVERAHARIDTLGAEVEVLRNHIDSLETIIKGQGSVPPPRPTFGGNHP